MSSLLILGVINTFDDFLIAEDEKLKVDLHDMQVDEARFYLEQAIEKAEYKIKMIEVVHGYRKGQAILNMVRYEYKHKRIEKKVIPFNKGITLIFLK